MTIAEVLKKATEGGYHIYGSDGMDTDYGGATSAYAVWTRKDHASSFIIPVEQTFLDPDCWQALGRALEWDRPMRTGHAVEHGRVTMVTRAGPHGVSYWHRCIDCLVEGKTAEDFFASVPCPRAYGRR